MPTYTCRKCGKSTPDDKWTRCLFESEDDDDSFLATCPHCGEVNKFRPPKPKDKKNGDRPKR